MAYLPGALMVLCLAQTPALNARTLNSPLPGSPAQSSPAQSSPAQSSPAQSSPAQSSPAQSSPAPKSDPPAAPAGEPPIDAEIEDSAGTGNRAETEDTTESDTKPEGKQTDAEKPTAEGTEQARDSEAGEASGERKEAPAGSQALDTDGLSEGNPPAELAPLDVCREASQRGAHLETVEACTAVRMGAPNVDHWLEAERLTALALVGLGRKDEAEDHLLAALVLNPRLEIPKEEAAALAVPLHRARKKLEAEGELLVEHDPVPMLKVLRQTELAFRLHDPLARVSSADAVFEFIDATETHGFARVPLSRTSSPKGWSAWRGRAPAVAWPPRWIQYRLELLSPAKTPVTHALPTVTLRPDAADEAAAAKQKAALTAPLKRPKKPTEPAPSAGISVLLGAAGTFSALTFGAAVVSVAAFALAASAESLVSGLLGLTLDVQQRQALRTAGIGASFVSLLGIPLTLVLGGVTAGLWTYYVVAEE